MPEFGCGLDSCIPFQKINLAPCFFVHISILCILVVHIYIHYVFVYPVLFFCTYVYILCILVPRFFEQFVPDD